VTVTGASGIQAALSKAAQLSCPWRVAMSSAVPSASRAVMSAEAANSMRQQAAEPV
jgi:adenine deaminase